MKHSLDGADGTELNGLVDCDTHCMIAVLCLPELDM
jgi:hypothetical protein